MGRLEDRPTRGGAGPSKVERRGGSTDTPVARFLWSRLAPAPRVLAPRPENSNWAICVGHISGPAPAPIPEEG